MFCLDGFNHRNFPIIYILSGHPNNALCAPNFCANKFQNWNSHALISRRKCIHNKTFPRYYINICFMIVFRKSTTEGINIKFSFKYKYLSASICVHIVGRRYRSYLIKDFHIIFRRFIIFIPGTVHIHIYIL